eukprot:GHVT01093882.1.p1 GENE.GHVT01093882.1~~GHVT01093882.1.p1  ORF type:complete len:437 (+),score=59.99 GHVT01093882.1:819-2129(+)
MALPTSTSICASLSAPTSPSMPPPSASIPPVISPSISSPSPSIASSISSSAAFARQQEECKPRVSNLDAEVGTSCPTGKSSSAPFRDLSSFAPLAVLFLLGFGGLVAFHRPKLSSMQICGVGPKFSPLPPPTPVAAAPKNLIVPLQADGASLVAIPSSPSLDGRAKPVHSEPLPSLTGRASPASWDPTRWLECVALLWGRGPQNDKAFLANRFGRRLQEDAAAKECAEYLNTSDGKIGNGLSFYCDVASRILVISNETRTFFWNKFLPNPELYPCTEPLKFVKGFLCLARDGVFSYFNRTGACLLRGLDPTGQDQYVALPCSGTVLGSDGMNEEYHGQFSSGGANTYAPLTPNGTGNAHSNYVGYQAAGMRDGLDRKFALGWFGVVVPAVMFLSILWLLLLFKINKHCRKACTEFYSPYTGVKVSQPQNAGLPGNP